MQGIETLIVVSIVMFVVLGAISVLAHIYNLNNIKAKTVGDGQHGTARWARKGEIEKTYRHIAFTPELWRKGKNLPSAEDQGIIVGCNSTATGTTALVDTGDVHALIIGAAGVGKTAYFLYPNLEYACASGMSFITSDTKGDLYRHYGKIAKEHYGYNVAVIDLRNPTKSDGNNLLHLVNKYMDLWKAEPDNLAYKAKAEKYAKIISKTIIMSGMDGASFGQNAFFYANKSNLEDTIVMLYSTQSVGEKMTEEERATHRPGPDRRNRTDMAFSPRKPGRKPKAETDDDDDAEKGDSMPMSQSNIPAGEETEIIINEKGDIVDERIRNDLPR